MNRKSNKLVCGIGIKGYVPTRINGETIRSYIIWSRMLARCYDKKYQEKRPTYRECYVCEEWHYFVNFQQWFNDNYVEGWQIDKDILIKENKVYSPYTCVFVPQEINHIFLDCGNARGEYPIGVHFHKPTQKFRANISINGKHKHLGCFIDANEAHEAWVVAKKQNIIDVANQWKVKIPINLYEALINRANNLE